MCNVAIQLREFLLMLQQVLCSQSSKIKIGLVFEASSVSNDNVLNHLLESNISVAPCWQENSSLQKKTNPPLACCSGKPWFAFAFSSGPCQAKMNACSSQKTLAAAVSINEVGF